MEINYETCLILNRAAISTLYLRAAGLHFRLSAFFDSPSSKYYLVDLLHLYLASVSFLETTFELESSGLLAYSTNYILQMIIAAGFTLLKLLNSFFANHIDFEHGRSLFNQSIYAIRKISVRTNDLPSRLAEVLAQLWKGSGASSRQMPNGNATSDNSLQLKVKCRMSMSLVFDSVWRWREEHQNQGRGNLDCTFSILACLERLVTHSLHQISFIHHHFLVLIWDTYQYCMLIK